MSVCRCEFCGEIVTGEEHRVCVHKKFLADEMAKRQEAEEVAKLQEKVAKLQEKVARPRMCPSPNTCKPLCGLSEKKELIQCEPGDSFVCFGKMGTEFEYEFEGVEHCNPLCSCHYTPRTGLIRFYETPDDWYFLGKAYAKARSYFEQHSNAEKAEADERKGQ